MDKKSTTKIEHYTSQNNNDTNEVLVLSPEDMHIKESIIFLHGHQVGMRPGAWETPRYLSALVTHGYQVYRAIYLVVSYILKK